MARPIQREEREPIPLRAQPVEVTGLPAKSAKRAFMLGFIPGVGAIYNAEYKKAAIHVGIFVLLSMILNVSPRSVESSLSWLRVAFVFYMAFEARHTAQKRS